MGGPRLDGGGHHTTRVDLVVGHPDPGVRAGLLRVLERRRRGIRTGWKPDRAIRAHIGVGWDCGSGAPYRAGA